MYILSLSGEGQRRLEGVVSVGGVNCNRNNGNRDINVCERHLSVMSHTTSGMHDSSDANGDDRN
jgi:hypothetical protein